MAVFSGKNLKVEVPTGTPLLHVQSVSVSEETNTQEYMSSSTEGNIRGVTGGTRVTGTVTVYAVESGNTIGKSGGPVPGTSTSMTIWENKNEDTTMHIISDVLWVDVSVEQDNESGAIVTKSITFISNGTYTRPTSA